MTYQALYARGVFKNAQDTARGVEGAAERVAAGASLAARGDTIEIGHAMFNSQARAPPRCSPIEPHLLSRRPPHLLSQWLRRLSHVTSAMSHQPRHQGRLPSGRTNFGRSIKSGCGSRASASCPNRCGPCARPSARRGSTRASRATTAASASSPRRRTCAVGKRRTDKPRGPNTPWLRA